MSEPLKIAWTIRILSMFFELALLFTSALYSVAPSTIISHWVTVTTDAVRSVSPSSARSPKTTPAPSSRMTVPRYFLKNL